MYLYLYTHMLTLHKDRRNRLQYTYMFYIVMFYCSTLQVIQVISV